MTNHLLFFYLVTHGPEMIWFEISSFSPFDDNLVSNHLPNCFLIEKKTLFACIGAKRIQYGAGCDG